MSVSRNHRILMGILFLTLDVFSAKAEIPSASSLNTRLTVQITSAPLHQFLETISAQTKVSFILSEDIDDSELVSENVTDREASAVLKTLFESKGLIYHQIAKTGTYVITSKVQSIRTQAQDALLKDNPAMNARFKFALHNTPLKRFLEMITADTGVHFTLAAERGKNRVTMNLDDVTAREALEAVLEIKNLDIVPGGPNNFTVQPRLKAAKP